MCKNKPLALRGTICFNPSANHTPDLIERPGCVFVAPRIEVAQILGDAKQNTQLLQAKICLAQLTITATAVSCFDQRFEHRHSAID